MCRQHFLVGLGEPLYLFHLMTRFLPKNLLLLNYYYMNIFLKPRQICLLMHLILNFVNFKFLTLSSLLHESNVHLLCVNRINNTYHVTLKYRTVLCSTFGIKMIQFCMEKTLCKN